MAYVGLNQACEFGYMKMFKIIEFILMCFAKSKSGATFGGAE